ncbi:MAG: hypothetical protein HUJ25_11550 [Crocinitomicaceae bacterium]|nr:hypothetical protein [Crocinitomicaceae bacterium]
MKQLLLLLLVFGSFTTNAQKVKKIIEKCDSTKLEKYLDTGGDINARVYSNTEEGDEVDVNLLTWAVVKQCKECVEFLITRRDDFDAFDLVVTEAFISSLSIGNEEVSKLLYEQNPLPKGICDACHGNNALMVAATYGREDWYFKLKTESDLSYVNSAGATLMHAAGLGPSKKILEDVLHIGSLDINKKDNEGLTPLDYAAANTENPNAFTSFLNHGADYKQAWNLLYAWCMFPTLKLTNQMIKERREDVWMIDDEGDNCLMLLGYFYTDLAEDEEKFKKQFVTILNIMIEDFDKDVANLDFVEQLYHQKITMLMLDAMLYIQDFDAELPIYPKYLELIGLICKKQDFCPVYKKEYKRACDIYGEETVNSWYKEFDLPVTY